jgi:hypothetical protein
VCSNSVSGTCVVPATVGATCSTDLPCDALLHCVRPEIDAGPDAGDAGPVNGTCEAEVTTPGGACAAGDGKCSRTSGLDCIGKQKVCAVLGVAAAGAPCGNVDGGTTIACTAGTCVIPSGQKEGTCQADLADNAPCALGVANPCLAPAKCIDNGADAGTCKTLDVSQCH